jgi:hypothetical protein
MNCRKVDSLTYVLRAEDESSFLIEFMDEATGENVCQVIEMLQENLRLRNSLDFDSMSDKDQIFLQKGWFFCMANNRKDSTTDRGTVYRSVAIFSSKINIFEPFKEIIEDGLRRFVELPIPDQ